MFRLRFKKEKPSPKLNSKNNYEYIEKYLEHRERTIKILEEVQSIIDDLNNNQCKYRLMISQDHFILGRQKNGIDGVNNFSVTLPPPSWVSSFLPIKIFSQYIDEKESLAIIRIDQLLQKCMVKDTNLLCSIWEHMIALKSNNKI